MYISQKRLAELLSKALSAIDSAKEVMDYCGGDAWERECTEADRKQFTVLVGEIREALEEYEIVANRQITGQSIPCFLCGGVDGKHKSSCHLKKVAENRNEW